MYIFIGLDISQTLRIYTSYKKILFRNDHLGRKPAKFLIPVSDGYFEGQLFPHSPGWSRSEQMGLMTSITKLRIKPEWQCQLLALGSRTCLEFMS
jgi:hypothetical protein